MDATEVLVHQGLLEIADHTYEVQVFARHDGSYVAKTFLGPHDVIINDAETLHGVLEKHRRLLPLALDSRSILRDFHAEQSLGAR